MLQAINNKFGTNISEETLEEIKNFTLLWNIFDNTIFNTHFSIHNLNLEIDRINPPFNDYQEIFRYFQLRYVDNGAINERFRNLNFKQNDREPFVIRALLDNDLPNNDKILAVGIIIFRFRNNLFHGIKDFHFLNGQIENFRFANRYLQIFLDL
ncbi:MAG: hypothetical protein U0T33_09495 [Bacteroidales bacterium]